MYFWRKLNQEQRQEVLQYRIQQNRPWHSPPLLFTEGQFHISAACYEHHPYIGKDLLRMERFSQSLLKTVEECEATTFAWCLLPNHYHLLVETPKLKWLKKELGKLHGRTSYEWNREEDATGRTVWFRCSDRAIRGERHYWATINYIHNNPVHHGYVEKWTDWPFSSAKSYLDEVGRDRAGAIWKDYPVLDYGKGWDDENL